MAYENLFRPPHRTTGAPLSPDDLDTPIISGSQVPSEAHTAKVIFGRNAFGYLLTNSGRRGIHCQHDPPKFATKFGFSLETRPAYLMVNHKRDRSPQIERGWLDTVPRDRHRCVTPQVRRIFWRSNVGQAERLASRNRNVDFSRMKVCAARIPSPAVPAAWASRAAV
jgi:hypothetical protein